MGGSVSIPFACVQHPDPTVTDDPILPEPDSWPAWLAFAEDSCRTYFHQRNSHWIALGARIWAAELVWSESVEESLPRELVRSALIELELRVANTARVLRDLALRDHEVSASEVLVECTRLGTELIRDGCRDLEADIIRTSRFMPGVDVTAFHDAVSRSIRRVVDGLLEAHREARPHFG